MDAAVEVAMKRSEMALESHTNDGTVAVFHFSTQSDEPGTLTLRRVSEAGPRAEIIHIDAMVGRFGNSQREAELMSRVQRRLRQLVGLSHAPLKMD